MKLLRSFLASFAVLMVAGTALAAGRVEPGTWPGAELAKGGRLAVANQVLETAAGITLAAASPTFTGTGTVTVGSQTFTIGVDAFATIQAAIDAVDPGGTVWVLPGNYLEAATNRFLYSGAGPYQFGIFVGTAKPNLTIMGVDGSGNPITSYSGVLSMVDTQARNTFGTSGFFIEGDHCTITGIGVGVNDVDPQKTIEVIGEDFTIKWCDLADVWGGVIYINDYRFDSGTNTSYVSTYHVEGNNFQMGMQFQAASGAGYSGPVEGRVVTGNSFKMIPTQNYASITFNGAGGVAWFVYPVGGALITGNTFDNTDATGQHIKARGDYLNAQMDWASYWNGNSFNKAACEGVAPPGNIRAYDYGVFTNARRIGSVIKDQVDQALAGDIVLVKAGAYTEQVVVTTNDLTIQGAGRLATTIQSPATLTASFATPGVKKPVVLVNGVTGVTIRDLTVDGLGLGNADYTFVGAAFWNAGGRLLDVDINGIEDTPFSGAQHGVGVYAYNNTGGPYSLEVGGVNVTDYQKGGMALNGAGLTVDVHDCTVTGAGQTTVTAQNGIQVSYGAGGTITNCGVAGNYYAGAGWTASGLLLYGPGSVSVSGGSVTGSQASAYFIDLPSGSVSGTDISVPAGVGAGAWGIVCYNSQTSLAASAVLGDGQKFRRPLVQPLEEAAGIAQATLGTAASSMSVALHGGCLTGPGIAGTQGIQVWSDGGGLNVTVDGMEITGWDYGITVSGEVGSAPTMDANHNAITGNLSAGFYGDAGTSLAQYVWWGDAGGPGVGGANPAVGCTTMPWLVAGTDLEPGCGFTPPPDNAVTPIAPATCITPAHPCVTVPVNIAHTDVTPIRGASVKVALSANLSLCNGLTTDITEGTYLNAVGSTHYEVTDNGDHTYTVDCAIMGATPGATAASGNLFNLSLRNTAGDGVGTVTVVSVILRDPDNVPLAATAGPPATITIDNTAPVAIANLAAAQQKTGNDPDGTTKIHLTFTAPSDAAQVRLYRAGWGNYPEYDDVGGGVPVWPGASWTLAATLTAPVAAYDDEVAWPARDFWYYVAVVEDACGNLSAVSNRTAGTLNYHLGDVHNGLANCAGDNQVTLGQDISFLGLHYGITLTPGDPWNCLDVGPTTNYSVNARPTTDNKVNFEDLMMFAINYGVVSAPQGALRPVAAASDEVWLEGPAQVVAGTTFTVSVWLKGAGDLQGLSAQLGWDGAVAEPVTVEAGGLAGLQNAVVLSGAAGSVDAALLGASRGFTGEGVLATVSFRALASGAPAVRLAKLDARDLGNQPVALAGVKPPTVTATWFGPAMPNPFRGATTLSYALAKGGAVELTVYGVDGRKVATLASGVQEAGTYRLSWDGAGARPGLYYARLTTPEGKFTRTLVLTR